MKRSGVGNLGRGDDAGDGEVTLLCGRGTNADMLVGEPDMERIPVGFRIDGHALDPEFAASPDHAESDFAPIGYENFFEHCDGFGQVPDRQQRITEPLVYPRPGRPASEGARVANSLPPRTSSPSANRRRDAWPPLDRSHAPCERDGSTLPTPLGSWPGVPPSDRTRYRARHVPPSREQ